MVGSILKIISEIPAVVRLVNRMIERYKKSKRLKREKKAREELDRIIEERDGEAAKDLLSSTISDIRRSVD